MSRHKTKAEEIRNPERYFNRYIAKEILQDQKKTYDYYQMFDSLDAKLAGGSEGISKKTQMLLETNFDGRALEHQIASSSKYGWIDLIDNPCLYNAIIHLTEKQKYLLTLRFHLCYTQDEAASEMGVSQQAINEQEQLLFKKIKKFFK